MWASFVRFVDRASLCLGMLAALLIAACILILNYMLVVRALGYSTFWQVELSVYLLIAATFLGSPYTLKSAGHIGIDVLPTLLGPRAAMGLQLIASLLGLLVCLFLGWKGLDFTWSAFVSGERSGSIWAPPLWPVKLTFVVGMVFTFIQYLVETWRLYAPATRSVHDSVPESWSGPERPLPEEVTRRE